MIIAPGAVLGEIDAMSDVRRAFVWASLARYAVMAINLAAMLVIARLLAPAEFGVVVLGSSVFGIAEAVRALGGGAYLIQQKDLTPSRIHTTFTVSLIATLVVMAAVGALVGVLSRSLGAPGLPRYLCVVALGYLAGPFIYPISALLSRQMAFGTLARISVATASVSAVIAVSLAVRGFSFMSFAWANAISILVSLALSIYYWRDMSIFRPSLQAWRSVVGFGIYDSAAGILGQVGESLPYLIVGRFLSPNAVGLCQRGVLLCLVPERVVLAGVAAVALPAFSRQARDGMALKGDYLRAMTLITAAQWPLLIFLMGFAPQIVALVLGSQWTGVVPLVQIFSAALLFSFPVTLQYPALVAVGAVRFVPVATILQVSVSVVVLFVSVQSGLHAAALGMLLVVPFNGAVSLLIVRHYLGFSWRELMGALRDSGVCAAMTGLGPLASFLLTPSPSNMSIAASLCGAMLSGVGCVLALWLTRHPLLTEFLRAAQAARGSAVGLNLARIRVGRLRR
jgi:O-antigen/teichoic acid export membrane protein